MLCLNEFIRRRPQTLRTDLNCCGYVLVLVRKCVSVPSVVKCIFSSHSGTYNSFSGILYVGHEMSAQSLSIESSKQLIGFCFGIIHIENFCKHFQTLTQISVMSFMLRM